MLLTDQLTDGTRAYMVAVLKKYSRKTNFTNSMKTVWDSFGTTKYSYRQCPNSQQLQSVPERNKTSLF